MGEASKKWPKSAKAALCVTMDNMGEAADLQRGLWPEERPIGQHFSVYDSGPKMLKLLRRYNIPATYFVESWNLSVYEKNILELADSGIEIGWHAWQHEPWAKLTSEPAERDNFQRSFDEMSRFVKDNKQKSKSVEQYKGFRPPSGIIHGDRTVALCHEYGMTYISPAAEKAAVVPVRDSADSLAVLPFRWRTVDAYYYMKTFGPLRRLKGEAAEDELSPQVLAERYITEIDQTIEEGSFVSLLFHPFLTCTQERLDAMERVLQHVSKLQNDGFLWVARKKEVADWILEHRATVGNDPEWDTTQWR